MNLWLLTTEYPPDFGGGIGTYCANTVRMLASHGHRVTVFVHDGTLTDNTVESSDGLARVVRFNGEKVGNGSRYGLGQVASISHAFSDLIEQFGRRDGFPDLIECQEYLGIGYFLLQKKRTLWPKLSHIPVQVTLHTPGFVCRRFNQEPEFHLPNYWHGEMERFSISAADGVVSPSQYLADIVRRDRGLEGIHPNIIPYPFFPPAVPVVASNSAESGCRDLVFLGRLEHRKGILQLLGYCEELWGEGTDFRLRLIGGDTVFFPRNKLMSECLKERYAHRFEAGQVVYEGKIPPTEIAARLHDALAVLVPSLVENFPNVVLESMSLGRVVLASDSGGQREIITDGKSGFLFAHDVPGSFKRQVRNIVAMNETERHKMGERARTRIDEMCGSEFVYARKMEVVNRLLGEHRQPRSFPFIRGMKRPAQAPANADLGEASQADLLSVIIPYYNMGQYLPEALENVTKMTYRPFELLVVDDGSNQAESLAVLHQMEARYPIRVIHKQNGGLASARNEGARHAKGEFIAFLDADDLVEPGYYARAVEIMKAYDNVAFVGAWSQYFGASDAIWPTWNPEPPYVLIRNTVSTGGMVLRRNEFLRYGLNDERFQYGWEDYESLIAMVRQGCRGVSIPAPLFRYRVRGESMLRQMKIGTMQYSYELIAEKHRSFFEQYAVEISNLLNCNGPGYLSDNPTFEAPRLMQYAAPGLREMLFLLARGCYRKLVRDRHGVIANLTRSMRVRAGRFLLR